MQKSCFGCTHLRTQGDTGMVWFCLRLGQKVGEDTYYSFGLPRPANDCWGQFEPEEAGKEDRTDV